jgi:acyl dehydratase
MALLARQLYFEAVKVGDELPPLVKPPVDRTQIARYAGASGDFNPLYVDEHLARNAGFPSALAPGMLAMGFIGELVVDWLRGARLRRYTARFVKIVWPGDVLTCRGRVVDRRFEGGGVYTIDLEVWAENHRGELVLKGLVTAQLYYSAEDDTRQRAGQPPLVVTPEEEAARLAKLSRAQAPKRPEAPRAPPPPPPRPSPARPAPVARPAAGKPAPAAPARAVSPPSTARASPPAGPRPAGTVARPPPPAATPRPAAAPARPAAAPSRPAAAPSPPPRPASTARPAATARPAGTVAHPAPRGGAVAQPAPRARPTPRAPARAPGKRAAPAKRPAAPTKARGAPRPVPKAKPAARSSRPRPGHKPSGKKRR